MSCRVPASHMFLFSFEVHDAADSKDAFKEYHLFPVCLVESGE